MITTEDGTLLFNREVEYRLPERLASSYRPMEGERPLFCCIVEMRCRDAVGSGTLGREMIMVVTDRRLHLIHAKSNAIFHPNYQMGHLLGSLELRSITSVDTAIDGIGEMMEVTTSDGSLSIGAVKAVERFEGLKVAPGRRIPFNELIDSLDALSA